MKKVHNQSKSNSNCSFNGTISPVNSGYYLKGFEKPPDSTRNSSSVIRNSSLSGATSPSIQQGLGSVTQKLQKPMEKRSQVQGTLSITLPVGQSDGANNSTSLGNPTISNLSVNSQRGFYIIPSSSGLSASINSNKYKKKNDENMVANSCNKENYCMNKENTVGEMNRWKEPDYETGPRSSITSKNSSNRDKSPCLASGKEESMKKISQSIVNLKPSKQPEKNPNMGYLSSRLTTASNTPNATISVASVTPANINSNFKFIGRFSNSDTTKSSQGPQISSLKISLKNDEKTNPSVFYCVRHPTKKAKYSSFSESPEESPGSAYYCSKCAIDIALQGKKVNEISDPTSQLEPTKLSESRSSPFSSLERIQASALRPEEKKDEQANTPTSSFHANNAAGKINLQDSLLASSSLLIQNQLNSISVEEEIRRSEIEVFLTKLNNTCNLSNQSKNQLVLRKNDIKAFYDKQLYKIEIIAERLHEMIDREKSAVVANLQRLNEETGNNFRKLESKLDFQIKDLNFIHKDINQNLNNILKFMEVKPFKAILSKYEEKLGQYNSYISSLYTQKLPLQKLTNSSKSNYLRIIDNELKNAVNNLLSCIDASTSFLKKDQMIESESPMPLEKNHTTNNNSSIYISFDNKEMFENASRDLHGNLILRESMLENSSLSNRNFAKKNITQNIQICVNDLMGSSVESERLSTEPSQSVSRSDKKSCEKNLFGTLRSARGVTEPDSPIEQIISTPKTNESGAASDPQSSKKYLNLLEKINTNQTNKGSYYAKVLKNNPFISPQIEKNCISNAGNTNKNYLSADSKQINANGEEGHHINSTNKEIKNYGNFFMFIENKLQNETEETYNNTGYQKTLFCSPHFKDVEPSKDDD